MKVYTNRDAGSARRRGVSQSTPIDAATAAVTCLDLAERLCGPGGLKRIGEKWVGLCPLPGHEEKTPSFTVYPASGGWWCYGCGRGGDVVNLAALAWEFPPDGKGAAEAAAFLLMEFGLEVPQRPPSWFARQARQAPVRDGIEEAMIRHVQRRLFRVFLLPEIQKIEDDVERAEEYGAAWEDLRAVARLVVARRRSA